jgi:hypothetical protein
VQPAPHEAREAQAAPVAGHVAEACDAQAAPAAGHAVEACEAQPAPPEALEAFDTLQPEVEEADALPAEVLSQASAGRLSARMIPMDATSQSALRSFMERTSFIVSSPCIPECNRVALRRLRSCRLHNRRPTEVPRRPWKGLSAD